MPPVPKDAVGRGVGAAQAIVAAVLTAQVGCFVLAVTGAVVALANVLECASGGRVRTDVRRRLLAEHFFTGLFGNTPALPTVKVTGLRGDGPRTVAVYTLPLAYVANGVEVVVAEDMGVRGLGGRYTHAPNEHATAQPGC